MLLLFLVPFDFLPFVLLLLLFSFTASAVCFTAACCFFLMLLFFMLLFFLLCSFSVVLSAALLSSFDIPCRLICCCVGLILKKWCGFRCYCCLVWFFVWCFDALLLVFALSECKPEQKTEVTTNVLRSSTNMYWTE